MLLQFLAFGYIAGDAHQGDDFFVLPISSAGNFNESGFATLVHDSQFVRLHIVTPHYLFKVADRDGDRAGGDDFCELTSHQSLGLVAQNGLAVAADKLEAAIGTDDEDDIVDTGHNIFTEAFQVLKFTSAGRHLQLQRARSFADAESVQNPLGKISDDGENENQGEDEGVLQQTAVKMGNKCAALKKLDAEID